MGQSIKPKRTDLLAAERGYLRPKSSGPAVSFALVYPNSYHIGMSSLGFQLAYRALNEHPRGVAERFFLDTFEQGSIESGTPLSAFDVVAFSASFEMDEPHVLHMLERSGIPIEAHDRDPARGYPLVAMGGVLVSVNRLPLYPFIDLFLHGDAEVLLPGLVDALSARLVSGVGGSRARRGGSRAGSRNGWLEAAEGLPGVEVTLSAQAALRGERFEIGEVGSGAVTTPSPKPPAAERLQTLGGFSGVTQILTPHTEFSDMALIDLARGCPHHCTFCWIGHNSPPFRERPVGDVIEAAAGLAAMTNRFGLVSSAVGAHPGIDEICREFARRGYEVSYSSLRVEEVTPTMLEVLVAGGRKAITIAPEAGSVRVRRLLGKRISDDQIVEVVERALTLGAQNIKLYYMIGIPSETEDEALEIIPFTQRIRSAMNAINRPRGVAGTLGVNLGVFVPKPNLPLNHIEPVPRASVKRRLRKVVQGLGRIPNTRVNASSPDFALAQSVLSMGGIEASAYLGLLAGNGGDWRAANREWARGLEAHIDSHARLSRIKSERVRRDSGERLVS